MLFRFVQQKFVRLGLLMKGRRGSGKRRGVDPKKGAAEEHTRAPCALRVLHDHAVRLARHVGVVSRVWRPCVS